MLTETNLTSQNNSKISEGITSEKETMQRFRQEHDQYRHFLVTGDSKDRGVHSATFKNMDGGKSGNQIPT